MNTATYWNNNGKYNAVADLLRNRIPDIGSVENPRKNPALEKFRKASNAYYDLYNNGMGNRNALFRSVFKLSPSHYGSIRDGYNALLYKLVEERMDVIVLDAAKEQGLYVLPVVDEAALPFGG